jgi:hypothetical protein
MEENISNVNPKVVPFQSVSSKLISVQMELKAEKGSKNSYGKYNYRNVEDILSEVKPLLAKNGLIMTMTDSLTQMGDEVYVESRCIIEDATGSDICSHSGYPNNVVTTSFAREPKSQAGMSSSQMTGTASSYARKYALGAMFLISGEACPDYVSQVESERNANKVVEEIKDSIKETPSRRSPKSPSKGKGIGKGLGKVIKDLGVMTDISPEVMNGLKTPIPCDKYIGKKVGDWQTEQFNYIFKHRSKIFPRHPNFIQVLEDIESGDTSIDQQVEDNKPHMEGDE